MAFVFLGLTCLLSVCMFVTLDLLSFALGRKGWRRLLSTVLLFYAQIIGTEFILGLTNLLYNYSLAAFNVLLIATVGFVVRQRYGSTIFASYLNNLRSLPRALKARADKDRFLTIACALAGLFVLWLFFLGVIFPPVDWDGNSYHLTYVADLVQNHNLYDVASTLPWLAGYPKGGEFIQAWSVLLAHNDTVADLSQLPFILLGIASLYAICRNFNLPKKSSLFCALLFLFTPMVISQSTAAYVDVMLCATFFASLALVTQRKYSTLDFVLIGITFSLLIAIKSSGVYFVALLLVWLLVQLAKTYGKQYRKYVLPAALVASPTVFGLYWYIKNWILYDSPIAPFGLVVHGKTLFPGSDYAKWSAILTQGMPHNHLLRWLYGWAERTPDPNTFRYDYDSSFTGLGVVWFVAMLPAVITAFIVAVKKRNYRLLGVFALFAVLLVVYPASFSPRYGVFMLGLGVLSTAYLLQYLAKYTAFITKGLLAALALLMICLNFTPQQTWSDVSFEVKGTIHNDNLHGYGTPYSRGVGEVYEIAHNLVQPGQTIAYTDGSFIYPLWNSDFSNRVIYVTGKNEDDWYKNVLSAKVDYLLISKNLQRDANDVFDYSRNQTEDAWAMHKFHNVIYDKYDYEIIKVR